MVGYILLILLILATGYGGYIYGKQTERRKHIKGVDTSFGGGGSSGPEKTDSKIK